MDVEKSLGFPSKLGFQNSPDLGVSGDNFDVKPLLSRIYALSNLYRISGERVERHGTYFGKYVLLLCYYLPPAEYDDYGYCKFDSFYYKNLISFCSELYFVRDDFEVLLVTKMSIAEDSEVPFHQFLSAFPASCFVLPYHDSHTRTFVCDYLGLAEPGFKCLLMNATTKLMLVGGSEIIPDIRKRLRMLLEEYSFDPIRSYDRLLKSMWPVIHPNNSIRRAGACPIADQLSVMLPEYPDDIVRLVLESKPIEIGQSLDVMSLLSGGKGETNYLVRNNGQRVQVGEKTFAGKYILLCCFHVPIFSGDGYSSHLQALVTTCYELCSTRDDFEMIVVAKMNKLANYEVVFDHFMSGFPPSCLVLPFNDSERRDFICNYLGLVRRRCLRCLVLDKGVDVSRPILAYGFPDDLADYGADAFPFSYEKLQEFRAREGPFYENPCTFSLEGLLGCNSSDVLYKINPASDQEGVVTISELKKKVVGLYLCVQGSLVPTLRKFCQQCKTQKLEFEIVVVYLPFLDCLDPQVYVLNVDRMLQKRNVSWWRLPFNNNVSLRLFRLNCYPCDDKLLIVGAHDAFVEIDAEEIVRFGGIDAYPFSRSNLVRRELDKFEHLTLESLLVHGSCDYVYKGKEKVPVTELRGKNILLYIDSLSSVDIFIELGTWYHEIKAKYSSFEVVFVRRHDTTVLADDLAISAVMPWLVCPFDRDHSASVGKKLFTRAGTGNALVEFGSNGQVSALFARRLLNLPGNRGFPFRSSYLHEGVIHNLRTIYPFMGGVTA